MPGNEAPFHSFTFTLIADKRPRASLRLRVQDEGMYELHVERGSASNPTSQFTRTVPLDVVVRLRDALQEIGVFGWEESYGDTTAPGSRRWTVSTVFKEGVFAVSSKGGSDVPAGFDALLEELYRLDFPRPDADRSSAGAGRGGRPGLGLSTALNSMGSLGLGSMGGMSAGDLGAYGAVGKGGVGGVDFSQLAGLMGESGLGDLGAFGNLGDTKDALADLQRNPQAFQQRMKDEFRHMSPDEQNRLLDALASTGMASRAWWERFLRGC